MNGPKKLRILFVSRAFPPIVGGIEKQNADLVRWLGKEVKMKAIINHRGKKFLPFFLPWAMLRSLWLLPSVDAILLGDGVLAIVAWFLRPFTRKPIISVVHGLDLTYDFSIYQWLWVGYFMKSIDRFVAVGNETIRVGVERGIKESKFIFIPNGVDPDEHYLPDASRSDLEKILGRNIDNKKILLTSGRLARRKGVTWFIRSVMPKLDDSVLYVVAGSGPDRENVEQAITETHLESRVLALGYVSDAVRDVLLNTCDLFIQPNIRIAGDMEGFGIAVIEAGACRLPVVTSRLEGLKDSIQENQNGYLIEPENAGSYIDRINKLLSNDLSRKQFGEQARNFVVENYRWEKIAKRYLEVITSTISR